MSLRSNIFALLAGGLLVFAFAPFNLYPLAIVCPAVLFWLWQKADSRQAFWLGLFFGIGFFGVGVSWVFVSIHTFGNTIAPVALLLTALFVLFLSLYPALNGYLIKRYYPENTFVNNSIVLPAGFALQECFRAWFLTGFPWLFLGFSQVNSPLAGSAPIIGVFGLTFLLCFLACLLVSRFRLAMFVIPIVFLTGWSLNHIQWTQPESTPIKVSLVQGNIPQNLKWSNSYLQNTLNTYDELTQQHWDSDLIVWTEAAVPLLYKQAKSFLDSIDEAAKENNTAVVTGIPMQAGPQTYYNAMLVLGDGSGTYYKKHLVPFG